jgi:preprotein translocase subunit SecG
MFKFLLVVHTIIAASMVIVILMQRSEGGGLAGGGSPTGLMSARGAADFMTRTTAILASLFILLSIGLAALASVNRRAPELDTTLDRKPISAPSAIPGVPMGGGATTTPPTPALSETPAAPGPVRTETAPVAAVPAATPKAQSREAAREVAPEPRGKVERRAEPAPKAEAPVRVTPPKVDTSPPSFKLEPKPTPAPAAPSGPPANAAGSTAPNP